MILKKKKEFVKFKDFYALLEDTFSEVDEYLKGKDLVSCEVFVRKLEDGLNSKYSYEYPKVVFDNSSSAMKKLLPYLKIYKGLREDIVQIQEIVQNGYNAYKEEQNRIEREKRMKGPYLEELKRHLKEHIAFFEVNVDAFRKNYPRLYGKLSDVRVRQKVAFDTVQYQSSYEESNRFI